MIIIPSNELHFSCGEKHGDGKKEKENSFFFFKWKLRSDIFAPLFTSLQDFEFIARPESREIKTRF